jgi:TRAP transporter TAXI family solute receptor
MNLGIRGTTASRLAFRRCIPATAVFVVLTVALFAGCVDTQAPVGPTVDVDGVAVPARIQIATASVGGSYHPMGLALASVLSDNLPGVTATAETSSGSNQNIRMLDAGQIDFGLSNAAITFPAIRGVESFEKEFPVRAVISLQSSIAVVAALANSGYETIADLEGARISIGPAGGGWDYFMRPILEANGLPYDNFQKIYETQASAMDLLTDGSVDAVTVGGSVPHATILSGTATNDLMFFNYDAAAIDAVTAEYPFIETFIIPDGTYEGQQGDLVAADSGTAQLLVREDADPDLVYLIAKTIYENRDAIAQMHPAGREITPERAARDIGIPYHEGAIRYFAEIGILPDSLTD